MSITELPDEPESTDAPVLDDEALDSLAPAIPAADVEDLRSRVHGPVHAAGDAVLAAAGPQLDVPLVMVEIRLLGGQLARRPRHPNAVAGREGAFQVLVLGPAVPELAAVVPALGKGVLAALEPWKAPGCVINFLGDVEGPAEVLASYPPAVAERLQAVKQAVDPDRVFSFGWAI